MSLKTWLNESPGAAAIEAEENVRRVQPIAKPAEQRNFDPRTEVSADAKYIVKNLVLWFLVLPALVGFLIWSLSQQH